MADRSERFSIPVEVYVNGRRQRQRVPLGRRIPERWRWAHRAYASALGYFWLPCVLCGRMSGGHEWRDIDGKSSTIYPDPAEPGHGQGICPWCTRAGKGQECQL